MAGENSESGDHPNVILGAVDKALKHPLCALAAFILAVAALFSEEMPFGLRVSFAAVAGVIFIWTLLPRDIKAWLSDRLSNNEGLSFIFLTMPFLFAFLMFVFFLPMALTKLVFAAIDRSFDTRLIDFFFNHPDDWPTAAILFGSWAFWNYLWYRIYKNFQQWKQMQDSGPPKT